MKRTSSGPAGSAEFVVERISRAEDHLDELTFPGQIDAVAAKGILGDRHFGNAARQVSIQSLEELRMAGERLGRPIDPNLTRRNITVSSGVLPRVRGQHIVIGEVVLEVFADAAPCKLMEELNGRGAQDALKRLAGIHCRVVTGGTVAVGDVLRLVNVR